MIDTCAMPMVLEIHMSIHFLCILNMCVLFMLFYVHADTILYAPVAPVCMCVTLDLHLSCSLCLRACLLHLSIHPQRANGNG